VLHSAGCGLLAAEPCAEDGLLAEAVRLRRIGPRTAHPGFEIEQAVLRRGAEPS
jgi:hypothetical protein